MSLIKLVLAAVYKNHVGETEIDVTSLPNHVELAHMKLDVQKLRGPSTGFL